MTDCFKNHPDKDNDKDNHYCRTQGYNNTLKCDGKWDCRDGQDEHNCPLFGYTQAIHPGMNLKLIIRLQTEMKRSKNYTFPISSHRPIFCGVKLKF